jgi:hypothetical protein
MEDRRAIVRTRVRRAAEIVVGDRAPAKIRCVLRDLTSAGACIALDCPYEMPDTFELTLDRGRSLRPFARPARRFVRDAGACRGKQRGRRRMTAGRVDRDVGMNRISLAAEAAAARGGCAGRP